MLAICLLIVYTGSLIFIVIRAKREEIPEEWGKTKYHKSLYRISMYLYKNWKKVLIQTGRKGVSQRQQNIREKLQCLQPVKEIENVKLRYDIEKLNLCLVVIVAGIFIVICSVLSAYTNPLIVHGNRIERKSYGEGNLDVNLVARVEDEELREEAVQVLINERKYTDAQLENFHKEIVEELQSSILGQNKSLKHITERMQLPVYIKGYPFRLLWECSDYAVLNPDGTLGKEELTEAKEVLLTVTISYFDWKRVSEFTVIVYPRELSREETLKQKLMEGMKAEDKNTENMTYMSLPDKIDGKAIRWSEPGSNRIGTLLIVLFLVVIALWIGKDSELHKMITARNQEMLYDYPEIVGKLSLLLGAGMSIRRSWQKIVQDYQVQNKSKRRYAYEEMLITYYEMDSGVAESRSYDNFAKRCHVQSYLKLGTLLSQNLKRGSVNLQQLLQKEAELAFEERKILAKRAGEEAGTKLLLPMMLMLAIVMIVVIVPAFLSFSI